MAQLIRPPTSPGLTDRCLDKGSPPRLASGTDLTGRKTQVGGCDSLRVRSRLFPKSHKFRACGWLHESTAGLLTLVTVGILSMLQGPPHVL